MNRYIQYIAAGLAMLLVSQAYAAVPNERRTALVIGNAEYLSSPLANPVNDASDMRDHLKKLGFNVIYRENANLRSMDTAVREFGSELKRGGIGVFYYAGHAIQLNGVNYLIPVDANLREEIDVRYETLDLGYVLDSLYAAENDLNIVILDACRDNPFRRSFRSAARGLARMDAPTGTLIAYATSPGSTAMDGDGRNGVYTKHLLEHINAPNLPIEQMFKKVRIGVADETNYQQIPWESSSIMGNFSFRKEEEKPEPPAPVVAQPVAQPQAAPVLPSVTQESSTDYSAERERLEKVRAELEAAYAAEKKRLEELNSLIQEKSKIAELQAQKDKLEKERLLAEKEAQLLKEQQKSEKEIANMEAEKAQLEKQDKPVQTAAVSKPASTTEPLPAPAITASSTPEPAPAATPVYTPAPAPAPTQKVTPAPVAQQPKAALSQAEAEAAQRQLKEEEARKKLAMLKKQANTASPQPAKTEPKKTVSAPPPAPAKQPEPAPVKKQVASLETPQKNNAPKDRNLSSTLVLGSNVSGAKVYLAKGEETVLGFISTTNWVYIGDTPLTKDDMPPGKQKIKLERSGYKTYETTVQLGPGSTVNHHATLVKEKSFLQGMESVY